MNIMKGRENFMNEIKLDRVEEDLLLKILDGYKVFQAIIIDLIKDGKVEISEELIKDLNALDKDNQKACNHFIEKITDDSGGKTTIHID